MRCFLKLQNLQPCNPAAGAGRQRRRRRCRAPTGFCLPARVRRRRRLQLGPAVSDGTASKSPGMVDGVGRGGDGATGRQWASTSLTRH